MRCPCSLFLVLFGFCVYPMFCVLSVCSGHDTISLYETGDHLYNNNVQYTEHNVAADAAKRDEMIDKSSQMGVPVIDIDGEIIIGFDQKKLSQLLDIKS